MPIGTSACPSASRRSSADRSCAAPTWRKTSKPWPKDWRRKPEYFEFRALGRLGDPADPDLSPFQFHLARARGAHANSDRLRTRAFLEATLSARLARGRDVLGGRLLLDPV